MKKELYILLGYIVLFSLKTHGQEQQYKIKRQKDTSISVQRQNTANAIDQKRASCSEDVGCGLSHNYCDPICKEKILVCHGISLEIFNTLTNHGQEGHAQFSSGEVYNVLSGTNCGTHWVRCYIHNENGTYYYRISAQPDYINDGLEYETYYSIPLLQAIYDQGINNIKLYRGTLTSTGDYILPIKVKYSNGDIGYYDISNDLP